MIKTSKCGFAKQKISVKTILWDFDGVILDSMKIKGDGFKELFNNYSNEYLKLIEKYHYENGGISRFEKIKYFYNEILNQNISEEEVLKLANKFAKIIARRLYDKNNLIKDTIDFIEKNYRKYNFHIVSGAEDKELNQLCNSFDLRNFFISIDGSPTKKSILVKNIIDKYNYQKEEIILIGDAITDYNASTKNDIVFYGYNNLELKKFNYIESFKEFRV
ncbi:MAG: haloacid dehalogenase [Sulfurimonas sp.]|nr:MAG: haloacid dehalogenase [Sulfurimonas sp.]